MSQIVAWKCDRTGKLFQKKSAYIGHLKSLARLNMRNRKALTLPVLFQKCMDECRTIQEISAVLSANADSFLANANLPLSVNTHSVRLIQGEPPHLVWLQFRYEHPRNFPIDGESLMKGAPVEFDEFNRGMIGTREGSIFTTLITLNLDDFWCMREYQEQMKLINILTAEHR